MRRRRRRRRRWRRRRRRRRRRKVGEAGGRQGGLVLWQRCSQTARACEQRMARPTTSPHNYHGREKSRIVTRASE